MDGRGRRALALARRWIGTPYRHQGSCRGAGADCLGLVRGVWRDLCGAEPDAVPPYCADWSEAAREERLWEALRGNFHEKRREFAADGDVMLFRMREGSVAKHLGIQGHTGTGASFVHAYSGRGVVESALTSGWARRVVARFDWPEG